MRAKCTDCGTVSELSALTARVEMGLDIFCPTCNRRTIFEPVRTQENCHAPGHEESKMKYPDKETYRKLYARYLSENGRHVRELVNLAGDLTGKSVLDLCGGAGELSIHAMQMGAEEVVLVDECSEMADWGELKDAGVSPFSESVEWVLENAKCQVDVAFCRQGVNYWLNEHVAENLAKVLVKDGLFIFNTFNKMPPTRPKVKQYHFKGVEYVEVSYLDEDGFVNHVQIRENMEPHVTKFMWISTERFADILTPHFAVDIRTDEATDLYICKKI